MKVVADGFEFQFTDALDAFVFDEIAGGQGFSPLEKSVGRKLPSHEYGYVEQAFPKMACSTYAGDRMSNPHDAYDDPRLADAARLLAEGRHDDALQLLLDAWRADPDNLDLAVAYASTLARSAREEEAEELFSTLADDCPKDARIWNNWGYLLLNRGEPERAVKKLEMALELSPGDFEAMVNMGIALDRMGRPDESLAFYQKALAVRPDSPVVYNNMGAALWRSNSPEAALEAFRTALRLNPRDASAANNMGIITMANGDYPEAEGFFRQALEIDPDSHAARKNLAAVAKQRKAAENNRDGGDKENTCREKPSSLF